jgi:hypothetical protein
LALILDVVVVAVPRISTSRSLLHPALSMLPREETGVSVDTGIAVIVAVIVVVVATGGIAAGGVGVLDDIALTSEKVIGVEEEPYTSFTAVDVVTTDIDGSGNGESCDGGGELTREGEE